MTRRRVLPTEVEETLCQEWPYYYLNQGKAAGGSVCHINEMFGLIRVSLACIGCKQTFKDDMAMKSRLLVDHELCDVKCGEVCATYGKIFLDR